MLAKHRLNAAHLHGAFLIAGVGGGLTGSWTVFLIAVAVLLIAAYHAGELRR